MTRRQERRATASMQRPDVRDRSQACMRDRQCRDLRSPPASNSASRRREEQSGIRMPSTIAARSGCLGRQDRPRWSRRSGLEVRLLPLANVDRLPTPRRRVNQGLESSVERRPHLGGGAVGRRASRGRSSDGRSDRASCPRRIPVRAAASGSRHHLEHQPQVGDRRAIGPG